MKIGVISDTHRNREMTDAAFEYFKNEGCSHVFHLGDLSSDMDYMESMYEMKIERVDGNMDFSSEYPYEKVVEIEGVRFLLTHGHTLDVRKTLYHLISLAKEKECACALYGHTHIPYRIRREGVLVLNPGSPSQPRGGSKKSIAVITVTDGKMDADHHFLG